MTIIVIGGGIGQGKKKVKVFISFLFLIFFKKNFNFKILKKKLKNLIVTYKWGKRKKGINDYYFFKGLDKNLE